ncbi:MAG: peptidase M4 family protein, partial [Candidatus Aminicenantes bacterium]
MKKNTYRSLLICLLLFLFIGMSVQEVFCQEQKQMAIVNKMKKKDPKFRIRWDEKTGVPVRLKGIMSTPIDAPPKGIAYQFFKENENLFKMTDSQKELQLLRVKKDARQWNHVKLQQTYKSLNVDGRTIVVHIDAEKKVRVVNGYYVPNIDVDTTAKVKVSKAIDTAKKNLKPKEKITEKPKSELVVYNFKGKTYLTWKVVLISRDPMGEFIYYVDAHTGKVVYMYNDLKIACVRQTYDAGNRSVLPGTLRRSEGDGPVNDADLDGAHDNMGTVCDLYNTRYNRDSYNNAGAATVTTVHFQIQYNNAFWSPYYQQFVFGDGDGTIFAHIAQALDVVAHEFTHAVTQYESNLVYHDEPGALNESLSDIFALMADPGDWLMGEDCYTPGTPGDALRYMDDPPRGGQPDHIDDYVTPDANGSQMDKKCYNSGDRNNGCVHFNSGIPNKAAYLMAVGGTHRGIKVSGIGLNNMLNIFYEVQVNDWLTPNSGFMDARDATLD